jgi:hypothetical protein
MLKTALLLLLSCAAPCGAQEAAVSTAAATAAPAAPPRQSPLTLNISKDSYRSRVGLDYSVRWDFSDLASFRPSLRALTDGVRAITSWDITENTRLDYYGFRTNPWRVIITKEKKQAAPPPEAGETGGMVEPAAPVYRKKVRLSISPLVDDLKRNFDDGLKDFLLRSSLKGVSPEWEKAGDSGRKAFVKDVLSLDIWAVPVPGVKETKNSLEYISK